MEDAEWKVLESNDGTKLEKNQEEVKILEEKIENYKHHLRLREIQRDSYNYQKKNLSENSILLLLDFKENIILGRG